MGGGKGGDNVAPPPQVDTAAQQQQVMAMMQQMAMLQQQSMAAAAAAQSQLPMFPDIPPAPDVKEVSAQDWAARRNALQNKIRADYANSKKDRKGRRDTIATSPLLDDQEPDTIGPAAALLRTNPKL